MLKDAQTPRYKVTRTHRTYSPQFKAELLAMSQQPSVSIAALARTGGHGRSAQPCRPAVGLLWRRFV
jgi:hypothetical protein